MSRRSYESAVRALGAEKTRHTVVNAAQRLFAEKGYARTTIAEIADAAGVAVNTVYTSVGGKPQLIMAVAQSGVQDERIAAVLAQVEATDDPRTVLHLLARGTGEVARRQAATIDLLFDNRNTDDAVTAAWDLGVSAYQARLNAVADRLAAHGALRAGISRQRARQILWFYFGFSAWRDMSELGWEWGNAAEWLAEQATSALLEPLSTS